MFLWKEKPNIPWIWIPLFLLTPSLLSQLWLSPLRMPNLLLLLLLRCTSPSAIGQECTIHQWQMHCGTRGWASMRGYLTYQTMPLLQLNCSQELPQRVAPPLSMLSPPTPPWESSIRIHGMSSELESCSKTLMPWLAPSLSRSLSLSQHFTTCCLLEFNSLGSIASNLLLSNEMLLGSSDNPVVIKSLWWPKKQSCYIVWRITFICMLKAGNMSR